MLITTRKNYTGDYIEVIVTDGINTIMSTGLMDKDEVLELTSAMVTAVRELSEFLANEK